MQRRLEGSTVTVPVPIIRSQEPSPTHLLGCGTLAVGDNDFFGESRKCAPVQWIFRASLC
jgi:hypothetical protein